MPWACPIILFGSTSLWYDALLKVWKSHDFMFPSLPRGASLARSNDVLSSKASAYLILRYLQEILLLPSLSMSPADAQRLRRHSFRHFIANLMRVLKFTWSESFQGGRWKESSVMPLRYAQEVQFVASVDIIVRVVLACEGVIRDFPLDSWPLFGGWERFLPDRRFSSEDAAPPVSVEPVGSEAGSDGDSSEDEYAGANVPKSFSVSRRDLPSGWERVEHTLQSGRVYHTFSGPGDARARSIAEAWRVHGSSPSSQPEIEFFPPAGVCKVISLSIGERVAVWWSSDSVFYVGSVVDFHSGVFTVEYEDGETLSHSLSETFVATALDVEVFLRASAERHQASDPGAGNQRSQGG